MPEPFVYQSTTCHPPTKKTLIKGLFLDSRGRYWLQRRTPSDGITLNTSLICGNERCSKLHFQAFAGTTFLVFANLRFPSCFVDVRQFSAGSNVIPERISINCQEWKKGQKIGPKWLFNPKWVTSYWFEGCSGHLQGQNIYDTQALICYSKRSVVLVMKHIEQITANLGKWSFRLLKRTEQGCVPGCLSTPGYRRNMLEQHFCSRRGKPMSILKRKYLPSVAGSLRTVKVCLITWSMSLDNPMRGLTQLWLLLAWQQREGESPPPWTHSPEGVVAEVKVEMANHS